MRNADTDERLEALKRAIATGEYSPDPAVVAERLIATLGLIRRVGRLIEPAPGARFEPDARPPARRFRPGAGPAASPAAGRGTPPAA